MSISLFDDKLGRALVYSNSSITAQLKNNDALSSVFANVIQEGWRRPNHSEKVALAAYHYSGDSLVWMREVLLYTGDTCRALARILVPAHQVGLIPWVFRLGQQPFGEVLFEAYSPRRERMCRHATQFTRAGRQFSLRARQLALSSGFQQHYTYWGRSSVLAVTGKQKIHCFVTEYFL